MIVTPGIVLTNTEELTSAKLNALGSPTIELEASDIAQINEDVVAGLGQGIAGINYLVNGDWALWTRGDGPLSLPEGVWTELADNWFAKADYLALGSGGGGTYAAYEIAADTQHQQWLHCAKLTGTLGCAAIDIGQRLPARIAAALYPKITVTFEVENQTGASLVPLVRFETCNSLDNYGATTVRISQALPAIANAVTSVATLTLDLSAYGAALRKGAVISLRFSTVNGVGKYVKVFAAKVEIGEAATSRITERLVETTASAGSAGRGAQFDYFPNPNLHRWKNPGTTCQEDVPTWGPVGWFARPSDGGTLYMDRSTTTAADTDSRYSARLTGGSTCTGTVDFGSRLDLPTASESRAQLYFSARIYNSTGAALSPELRIDSCNSDNNFSALTNRVSQVLDPCASGVWTTVGFALDSSSLGDWEKGVEIYLRFGAGTLDNVAKVIQIARPRLEPGEAESTFTAVAAYDPPATVNGAYAQLLITTATVNPAENITITADQIVLQSAGGLALHIPSLIATVNILAHGANGLDYAGAPTASTWHYIYAISTGESHAGLLSKSVDTPTLPDGYLFAARIGAIRMDAGSHIPHFVQHGKEVSIALVNAYAGSAAANNVWQTLSLANFVPPTAVAVWGNAGNSNAVDLRMRIAADAPSTLDPAIGEVVLVMPNFATSTFNFRASAQFRTQLAIAQTLYWMVAANTAATRIDIVGYTLL